MGINESSINRAIKFMLEHDIACLTAFRGQFKNATENTLDDRPQELKDADVKRGITKAIQKTPYQYSTAEKKKRNRDLKASLLKYGYGVTSIAGNYIENFNSSDAREVGESSYFVVNLKDDPNFFKNIFVLSELYNQDCFLYKPKDSDEAYNVGTNNCEWPGYNIKEPAGKFHINIKSEFLSRVGNSSFAFKPDGDKIEHDETPYNFQTRKQQRLRQYMNNESKVFETYEDFSRNAKNIITNIHERNMRYINEMKGITVDGVNENVLESIRKRLDFINKYDETHKKTYTLNEGMWDTDMKGWINIGVIKNGSNIGAGGDAYLMVDPNYPQTNDSSTFKYRATGYNTKPDGTGYELQMPEYQKQYLQIYDQYRDTYYGELFLGKKKTDEQRRKHEMFMSQLDMSGDKVLLKHDSSFRITDGVVRKGTPNGWSNNSDVGIYFWGSKNRGSDPSNGGQYTYYCAVSQSMVYDFENDMERYGTLMNAFKQYQYVSQYWKGGPEIVVNTYTPTPITYIRDNSNGKVYDANWREIGS